MIIFFLIVADNGHFEQIPHLHVSNYDSGLGQLRPEFLKGPRQTDAQIAARSELVCESDILAKLTFGVEAHRGSYLRVLSWPIIDTGVETDRLGSAEVYVHGVAQLLLAIHFFGDLHADA